jgi:hypothetical protein
MAITGADGSVVTNGDAKATVATNKGGVPVSTLVRRPLRRRGGDNILQRVCRLKRQPSP